MLYLSQNRRPVPHALTSFSPPLLFSLSLAAAAPIFPGHTQALVPCIRPACGHVHGYAPQLVWGPCPMCRTKGPLVEVTSGRRVQEASFVCLSAAGDLMSPCHVVEKAPRPRVCRCFCRLFSRPSA